MSIFERIFGSAPRPASFEETKRREREALEREEMVKRAREAAKQEHERSQRIAELQAAASLEQWAKIKSAWKAFGVGLLICICILLAGAGILILSGTSNGWGIGMVVVALWILVGTVCVFIEDKTVQRTFQFWNAQSDLHALAGPESTSGSPSSKGDGGAACGTDRKPEKPGSRRLRFQRN